MTLKDKTETLLEQNPRLRERRYRLYELARYLAEKYHIDRETRIVEEVIKEAADMDRYCRMIQNDREDLQGNDYNTKRATEEKKELELGYEPRYFEDIKQETML